MKSNQSLQLFMVFSGPMVQSNVDKEWGDEGGGRKSVM